MVVRHLLRLLGKITSQPACYYSLTEAYCELVGVKGKNVAFKANFIDGPWAGQSLTMDHRKDKFEITRAGKPAEGTVDTIFCYEHGPVRMSMGIEEADFKISYDGPLYQHGGKNA